MGLVHVVLYKHRVEGKSIRRIVKETGLHRDTVRRYLRGAVVGERKSVERKKPVHDAVFERIEKLVEDSRRWTEGKQRLTARRVMEMIKDGDDGGEKVVASYTVVKEIVAEVRRRQAEVYVPLVYRPGDLAEVDFFEVVVDVEGKRAKAWMFVMRLMFSARDFCFVYPRQDQTCFLDGHVRAFAHFGVVPRRIAYDNLKAAVRKHLVGSERELALRFAALSTHYGFEACFARPRTGHDKGGVEARGKGIRWQHLVPIPTGTSLVDVSEKLMKRVDERVDEERFAEERPHMKTLPAIPYRAVKTGDAVAISPRALVKVDGAVYSVPCIHARLSATVHAGAFDVEIVCPDGERIVHVRQPANGRSVRYMHYLRELRRKPQAVRQVAHVLVEELGAPFIALWIELCEQHPEIEAARRFAKALGLVDDLGVDEVARRLGDSGHRRMLTSVEKPSAPPPTTIAIPDALAKHNVEKSNVAIYDELIGSGVLQ